MRQFMFFSVLFFLLLSFASCKQKVSDSWEDTLTTGIIKIACDENFANLMNAEIDAFEAHYDYALINPVYSNEDEVIQLLLDDSVRLALTTRDLNAKEQRIVKERQMYVQKYLIAFDGITFIANKANVDSLIGLPTIKKILTGEITDWSQINPQSTLGTIRVLFDSNQSGITRYVVDSITKGEPLSPHLYLVNNSEELLEKIAELPNALGILGFNQISNEVLWNNSGSLDNLRIMRVGREENATLQNTYSPFAGDIKSEDYPLWRPVYVLLSDPRSGLPSGFSLFLAYDIGQRVILMSGLLPAVTDPQNRSVYITE